MLWLVFREMYVERLRTRSPGSDYPEQVRIVLERFTRYRNLFSRTVAQVAMVDLDEYVRRRRLDTWRGRPIKVRSINNEILILNAAFRLAGPREPNKAGRQRLGLVAEPIYYEPLPEEEAPSPVALTVDRIDRFLMITEKATTPRYAGVNPADFWATVVMLALVSALRRRALLTVPRPPDEILIGQRLLPVPASCSKTRVHQNVPLPADLVDLLLRLPSAPGEPLLCWRNASGQPLSLKHFSTTIREMQIAAGVPKAERILAKHFRSTAATLCLEEFGELVARRRLGHAPGSRILERNYVQKRVTAQERAASESLGELVASRLRVVRGAG